MKDANEHEHSESAYEMLSEHIIGRLGAEETIVSDGTPDIWGSTRHGF